MENRLIKTICTFILITTLVACITAIKIYANEHKNENVLPAVDILVIEAGNTQGYN